MLRFLRLRAILPMRACLESRLFPRKKVEPHTTLLALGIFAAVQSLTCGIEEGRSSDSDIVREFSERDISSEGPFLLSQSMLLHLEYPDAPIDDVDHIDSGTIQGQDEIPLQVLEETEYRVTFPGPDAGVMHTFEIFDEVSSDAIARWTFDQVEQGSILLAPGAYTIVVTNTQVLADKEDHGGYPYNDHAGPVWISVASDTSAGNETVGGLQLTLGPPEAEAFVISCAIIGVVVFVGLPLAASICSGTCNPCEPQTVFCEER